LAFAEGLFIFLNYFTKKEGFLIGFAVQRKNCVLKKDNYVFLLSIVTIFLQPPKN
jgi:hypothetical protein